MAKCLFGTDGIRGVSGTFPLDDPTVSRLGQAVVRFLHDLGRPGRIVLGYDTRASSHPLCRKLVEGIRAAGGNAAVAGVLPTPGVAFLTRNNGFDAGIVISASHNPYTDNGIKVFQADGTKLPDGQEEKVERLMFTAGPGPETHPAGAADFIVDEQLVKTYIDSLLQAIDGGAGLKGTRVVLDCANGASSAVAPPLMQRAGVAARFLAIAPDGTNINRDCGSLHPELLAETVRDQGAAIGLAFDGDADRCLAVDETGRVLDGDFILYLLGRFFKQKGQLRNDTIVATVMSNLWLEQQLQADGIRLLRTPVGDKYVLEEMIRGDHSLGGEQSGHVILRQHSTTGDGLLTGLMLLMATCPQKRPLSELVAGITPCPQVLLNVPVGQKPDLETHPRVGPVLRRTHARLRGRGRLLVRYSGTEPLARVMAEGTDLDEVRRSAEEVAAALREHLS
ncbi:MAG: phosphoglucosamine mutase [Acidobacteriota bacterium]